MLGENKMNKEFLEPCCVRRDELVTADVTDGTAWIRTEPYGESEDITVTHCPFCGKRIRFDLVACYIYESDKTADRLTFDEFYDKYDVPKSHRSDFATMALVKQASDKLKLSVGNKK